MIFASQLPLSATYKRCAIQVFSVRTAFLLTLGAIGLILDLDTSAQLFLLLIILDSYLGIKSDEGHKKYILQLQGMSHHLIQKLLKLKLLQKTYHGQTTFSLQLSCIFGLLGQTISWKLKLPAPSPVRVLKLSSSVRAG